MPENENDIWHRIWDLIEKADSHAFLKIEKHPEGATIRAYFDDGSETAFIFQVDRRINRREVQAYKEGPGGMLRLQVEDVIEAIERRLAKENES